MHISGTIKSSDIVYFWKRLGISVERLFSQDFLEKFECEECGLGYYLPLSAGDNLFYGDLTRLNWYYQHAGKTEFDFAGKYIKPAMRVLDVGCGIGEFSSHLSSEVVYLGAEFSSKSVQIAKEMGRNVVELDITNCDQKLYGTFDVVVCFQVLEHISEINLFLESLKRLCKPKGKIIIAVPNNDGFIAKAVNNILNLPPHHLLYWNRNSLEYISYKHQLTLIEYFEESLTPIHRAWYQSVKINNWLDSALGRDKKILDISIFGRTINLISKIAARIIAPFAYVGNISGHTSIIVFEN
ncbi:class I SAM-dependent methyltransferase [Polynucleobacter sp. AP-Jannik-300A-C4]|uniref:class I SAM-dependent methyltransferase n=1 Tax=Polynucleobacter sp. AP-Jannik-300A-C4 TaxID=2576928 RepID=UPI001BFE67A8|nr:class I SAM-dependent methyltransferase [Polynucleobacter sp. AP-Jannik-300A-C4]QWE22941.1 class I SAM-dependent methyltransferase [Polynucleobacter sp. AP-Jannik-300A-C4]